MSVDYSQGYTARWRLQKLDVSTWVPMEDVPNVISFSLDKDGTDTAPLLETGSVEIDVSRGGAFYPGWYRMSMVVEQSGALDVVPIATLWFEATKGTVTGYNDKDSADGRSVLYPASVAILDTDKYAPKGVDGAAWCANFLRKHTPAPVNVEGSFTLEDYYVFQEETKVLEAVWTLLDAGGFCIQIDGDGTINIRPKPTEPALVLSRNTSAILSASYDYTQDSSNTPNVYVAIDGDSRARAENNDPYSQTSTVSRGFEVVTVDTSPVRVNGETLQSYAERRLYEERTMVERVLVYTREYWPDVAPFSIVRWFSGGDYPQDLTVKSQTLSFTNGIQVKETAVIYMEV